MSSKQPSISIVILNFNGREFLDRCLGSVLGTDYSNFEVIFVDNASTDGSIQFIKEKFGKNPRLKIIQNKRNLGFAEGNNIGARAAKGELIVFLNTDTKVPPNWLNELMRTMGFNLDIGICQSKLMFMYDKNKLESAGGFIDYYGFPYMRGGEESIRENVSDIFFAEGAAMIVRKKVLDEVGLFDPAFFCYSEEVDLCWRAQLKGYRVVYVPTSTVYHAVRGTASKFGVTEFEQFANFHTYKNIISMLSKNYEINNLVKYLPVSLTIMFIISISPIKSGKFNIALIRLNAYLKAIYWNILNFKHIWRKRLTVQYSIRREADEKIKEIMIRKPVMLLSA